MDALEESKDPVVPRGISPLPQPLSHQVQNLPTLQQHVKLIRGEKGGIPVDELKKFQRSFDELKKILSETDQSPSVMQFAVAVAAYLNMATDLK